jgi:hypothetical protein
VDVRLNEVEHCTADRFTTDEKMASNLEDWRSGSCNTPKSYHGELRKFPKDLKFQVYYNKVMN